MSTKYNKYPQNTTNDHKIQQMTTKYNKCLQNVPMTENRPNGHKIYRHRPLQDPRKFTQIGIFGLKIPIPSGNTGCKYIHIYSLESLQFGQATKMLYDKLIKQPICMLYDKCCCMTENSPKDTLAQKNLIALCH
jgi:hypothetical protein